MMLIRDRHAPRGGPVVQKIEDVLKNANRKPR
jgi:hypothetical protein